MPDNRSFLDTKVNARLARLTLRPRGLVEGSFSGMHKSPHRGASVEFAEYRKYVKGDDIRHIDWRAYARTDRIYLKEFEADTHLRCYLVVDCSGSMGFAGDHGSKLDYARKLAATLAWLVVHQGDHVGIQLVTDEATTDIPPRGKPSHLRHIFDSLAGASVGGPTSLVENLHALAESIRKRAMVVVISDFYTEVPPLLDCFQHLRHRKHDVAAFHLLDPQELRFEFARPVRFADMEGGEAVIAEPTLIREQYLHAIHYYLDEMKRGCGQFDEWFWTSYKTSLCSRWYIFFAIE